MRCVVFKIHVTVSCFELSKMLQYLSKSAGKKKNRKCNFYRFYFNTIYRQSMMPAFKFIIDKLIYYFDMLHRLFLKVAQFIKLHLSIYYRIRNKRFNVLFYFGILIYDPSTERVTAPLVAACHTSIYLSICPYTVRKAINNVRLRFGESMTFSRLIFLFVI